MSEMDEMDEEEYEEQIERMIVENGVMLRALAGLLVRKNLISQDELDREVDTVYNEIEDYGDDEGRE